MSFERANIRKMQGYTPGEQIDSANIIKLNTNENPYPPSPEVASALLSIDLDLLRRYPQPMADKFRAAAANLHKVLPENIIATNGSDELLRLAITTFVEAGETIAVTQPTYSLYPVLADIQDCKLTQIPLHANWDMPADFAEQLENSAAKMLLLVNPQAPTGKLISTSYIAQLASNFSGLILLDEAYVDFVDPDLEYNSVSLIENCENVLILRTLSKGYSLAGLRFGYGIGATSLINPMMFKTRDSYNTDHISQQLASAALSSTEYSKDIWQRVRSQRNIMRKSLNELGFVTPPTQTNFLLCQVPDSLGAENLYQLLKQRNILVRHFDQDRLRNKLRITIGKESENVALITAIKEIVAATG
ncbi:MAG: histidinol-phosphate transaminase [SAR86 cluster bacterium]|uniref:Histidinol-phosphate aminotransferase n=1 Tax=SAR86 cluster bacterium TaxID=2030880 RepID=A0A2A5B8S4_9GAMM|nr:MAG: histidinol-phosphate transaminase [SAR86 cluster bacterium]